MTDRYGALTLPVTAGELNIKLDVLLAFARAVLVEQVQTAWADAAPVEPHEIVNKVYSEDPRKVVFVERDLPALFAYEEKGEFEDLGDGFDRHVGKVRLDWLFPPSMKERKRPLDKIPSAIARVLSAALNDGRHPAWVHADDEAQPGAIMLATTAPTVDTTYDSTDFNGDIGADYWAQPGRVSITTTLGDWDTTQPIGVQIELADGAEHTEEVYLTSSTGPETIEASWVGRRALTFDVPGQPSADGTIAFGLALAPGCEHGSEVARYMGATRVRCASWKRETIEVRRADGPAMRFDGACFEIEVHEMRSRTGEALGYASLDDATDGIGMTGKIVSVGGLTIDVENE